MSSRFIVSSVFDQSQAQVLDFLGTKAPSVVVSQNPPAGTAVPEGMTIEVRVASKSDIPVGVFVPGLTGPIKELSYAAFEELAINDPTVKETRTTGTLDPAKEAAFVDAFNTKLAAQGATGRVSATEAQVVFGNFKNAGLFSLAR